MAGTTDGTPQTTGGSVRAAARTQPDNRTGNPVGGSTATGRRVPSVHRAGALVVAAVIAVFGLLGFAGGLGFFDTTGSDVVGLSTNGLLSTISLVTAGVLVVAALRSPRTASTIMIVVGVLFLISAFANLAVLDTDLNLLAFRLPNVFFSIGAGLVLLLLGAYGRVSGNLPEDSPYRSGQEDVAGEPDDDQGLPETPAERAAETAMREAELAVVNHTATQEQQRRVELMAPMRTRRARREVWMRTEDQLLVSAAPAADSRAGSLGGRLRSRLHR